MTKYCTSCGTALEDNAAFCTNCGHATADNPTQVIATPDTTAVLGGSAAGVAGNADAVGMTGTAGVVNGSGTVGTAGVASGPGTVGTPGAPTTPLHDTSGFDVVTADTTAHMEPVQPTSYAQSNRPVPPTNYTQGGNNQQPAGGNKKPIIIAVVVAAVVILAALIVGFFVLSEQGDKSSSLEVVTSSGAQPTTANTCEVVYETGGGTTVSTSVVTQGQSITSPTDPTRSGYTFDGWYLDPTYQERVVFPFEVTQDTILYAKWVDAKGSAVVPSGSTNNNQGSAGGNASVNQSTVTLTVTGSDGQVRSAQIHRQGNTGRVFPDSNSRRLSASEVSGLSDGERCVAWNEIIAAANGYEFKNGGLENYFTDYCSWYHGVPGASGSANLSAEANANIQLLKDHTDSWWQHLSGN